MVHLVVRHHALRFVVIVPAGVHVPVEAREIAARNLDADAMARRKVVARGHRLEADFIDLARFHPHRRFVVPVAITDALDSLVEVVGRAVRMPRRSPSR